MSLKRFGNKIEIGCDEAGRGSLSGPVVASAVILPRNFKNSVMLIVYLLIMSYGLEIFTLMNIQLMK